MAGAFAAFGLPPPRADASDGDDVAPVCQLPSPPPALPSPVAFASPRAGPSFLASTASTTASTSPEVLASTTSSPRSWPRARTARRARLDGGERLARGPRGGPRGRPDACVGRHFRRLGDAAPPAVDGDAWDSDASSSPEASPRGPMPSPDDTAARAARVLGSSIDDSSSSDGDEAPRAADAADATPSTRASPSTCDASPATPIFSPPAIPAIDATPARVAAVAARAGARRGEPGRLVGDPGRDENDDPGPGRTPRSGAEDRRRRAYKRARAGGATERADCVRRRVWRDVRRALGHARPPSASTRPNTARSSPRRSGAGRSAGVRGPVERARRLSPRRTTARGSEEFCRPRGLASVFSRLYLRLARRRRPAAPGAGAAPSREHEAQSVAGLISALDGPTLREGTIPVCIRPPEKTRISVIVRALAPLCNSVWAAETGTESIHLVPN